MKSYIMIALSTAALFIATGCGGDTKQEEMGKQEALTTSSVGSEGPSGNAMSEPGPFSAGDFGEIKLHKDYESTKVTLSGATLIDIRTAWEREHFGYPENFTNIAYQNRDYKMVNGKESYNHKPLNPTFVTDVTKLVNGDLNKKIILLCDSSSRSGAHGDKTKPSAAKLLSEKGFTNVYHIYGGFRGNASGNYNNGWLDYHFPLGK